MFLHQNSQFNTLSKQFDKEACPSLNSLTQGSMSLSKQFDKEICPSLNSLTFVLGFLTLRDKYNIRTLSEI
jgi:hypothetical protein